MTAPEACSLVLERGRELAVANAAITRLEIERAAYRELATQAIHLLAEQEAALRRADDRNARLRDELRRYTAGVVSEVAA